MSADAPEPPPPPETPDNGSSQGDDEPGHTTMEDIDDADSSSSGPEGDVANNDPPDGPQEPVNGDRGTEKPGVEANGDNVPEEPVGSRSPGHDETGHTTAGDMDAVGDTNDDSHDGDAGSRLLQADAYEESDEYEEPDEPREPDAHDAAAELERPDTGVDEPESVTEAADEAAPQSGQSDDLSSLDGPAGAVAELQEPVAAEETDEADAHAEAGEIQPDDPGEEPPDGVTEEAEASDVDGRSPGQHPDSDAAEPELPEDADETNVTPPKEDVDVTATEAPEDALSDVADEITDAARHLDPARAMFRKEIPEDHELPSDLTEEKKVAVKELYAEAEANDIAIVSGEEAEEYFRWVASREDEGGGNPEAYYAVTMGDTIIIRDSRKFDTRTLGEELIHSKQQMAGRGDVYECEIEARETLLVNPEKYALTPEEVAEVKEELTKMRDRGYY